MKEGYSDLTAHLLVQAHVCCCVRVLGPTLAVSRMQRISWPPGHLCFCLSWWPGLRVGDSSSGKFGNNRSSQEHYPLHPRTSWLWRGQRAPRVPRIPGSSTWEGWCPGAGLAWLSSLSRADAQGGWEVGGEFFLFPLSKWGWGHQRLLRQHCPPGWGRLLRSRQVQLAPLHLSCVGDEGSLGTRPLPFCPIFQLSELKFGEPGVGGGSFLKGSTHAVLLNCFYYEYVQALLLWVLSPLSQFPCEGHEETARQFLLPQ